MSLPTGPYFTSEETVEYEEVVVDKHEKLTHLLLLGVALILGIMAGNYVTRIRHAPSLEVEHIEPSSIDNPLGLWD